MKLLVVLSGGQDSTYCLFWARRTGHEVHALTFDYGQRHAEELRAAARVARMAGVASHHTLGLNPAIFGGTSPLVSDAPLAQYESAEDMKRKVGNEVEATFVPGRNIVFASVAAAFAAGQGLDGIVLGVSSEDYANYPDCRPDFIASMRMAVETGLGHPFEIITPLLYVTKAQSIVRAREWPELWEALAFTHTAYNGLYPPTGHDHASILRAKAFLDADLPDPLVLRAVSEGLMPLPDSTNYEAERGEA